jgi:hypothetical protein
MKGKKFNDIDCRFTFVLIVAFDLIFGAALFIWLLAIVAGTFNNLFHFKQVSLLKSN